MLSRAGADVWRVGFNMGDRMFWPGRHNFIAYRDAPEAWGSALEQILDEKSVTDIVLYGDTRPIHATAVEAAKTRGLRIHVFEEGYMRPYWVTYERGGANGHSRLMDLQVETMRRDLENSDMDTALPPASWGDMRQHIFYGALYHGFVLLMNRGYRGFRPHRSITVRKEFALYLQRLVLMPVQAVDRRIATWRIRHGGFPYHLALLQLEHDSSFQMHSPFASMTEFLETVIDGFAKGAPQHHHLVVKAHPLEDGRVPVRRELKRLARSVALLTIVTMVASCRVLPRLGPTKKEIYSGSVQRSGDAFVVSVNDRVTRATAVQPALGFTEAFKNAGQLGSDTIRPGDTLGLTIWENVDDGLLAGEGTNQTILEEVQVDGSGFIFVPYAGRIRAAGNTPEGIRRIITSKLDEQTPDPQVQVRRLAGDGSTVSLVGSVGAQGVYPIERPTRTLSTMLSNAGGIVIPAEVAQITVLRGGERSKVWFQDLYKHPEFDIALRGGDRILVEEDSRSFTALGATGA